MADERICCLACSSLDNLNICPRCGLAFCSVKCYRSVQHQKCSEAFYRQCIEQQIGHRKIDETTQQPKNFEQFMKEQFSNGFSAMEVDDIVPGQQAMFDSDDEEEDSYLENVEDGCISEYQSVDERELDRKLTILGIGTDESNLLSSLTDAEKRSFSILYDKLKIQEMDLDRSVFTNKKVEKRN